MGGQEGVVREKYWIIHIYSDLKVFTLCMLANPRNTFSSKENLMYFIETWMLQRCLT